VSKIFAGHRLRGWWLRVTETASSLGVVMHAAYRQAFEITNESTRIKF
jgi:hypothetical protein